MARPDPTIAAIPMWTTKPITGESVRTSEATVGNTPSSTIAAPNAMPPINPAREPGKRVCLAWRRISGHGVMRCLLDRPRGGDPRIGRPGDHDVAGKDQIEKPVDEDPDLLLEAG